METKNGGRGVNPELRDGMTIDYTEPKKDEKGEIVKDEKGKPIKELIHQYRLRIGQVRYWTSKKPERVLTWFAVYDETGDQVGRVSATTSCKRV